MKSLCFFRVHRINPCPGMELTKNNSQVIAGGPAAKALIRYHGQLAPSRYLPVLPTANPSLVFPVSHIHPHTHSLVLFALPKLLLLFLKAINFFICPFLIQYLSGTKVAQATLLECKEDSKSTFLSLKNVSAWKAAVP